MSDWPRSMEVRPIASWPGAQTGKRRSAPFTAGLTSTLQLLDTELRHLGVRGTPVLEVAIPAEQFRLDGRPRANATASSPAVILTVVGRPGAMSYPCDRFTTWQDNLRAIALALEALRKVDRYGVTAQGEQYRGFLAIEAAGPGVMTPASARQLLLRLVPSAGPGVTDAELIRAAKRAAHPDQGGNVDLFQQVLDAERTLTRSAAA